MLRIRQFLVRLIAGRMPVIMNVRVLGKVEVSAPGLARNVQI